MLPCGAREDNHFSCRSLLSLDSQKSLVAFMRESPLAAALQDGELKLMRSRDLPRDVAL